VFRAGAFDRQALGILYTEAADQTVAARRDVEIAFLLDRPVDGRL